MVLYELWDVEGGSRLGSYPDQGSALAEVRKSIAKNKAHLWGNVGLLALGADSDQDRVIAEGAELIALAQATPTPTPRSRPTMTTFRPRQGGEMQQSEPQHKPTPPPRQAKPGCAPASGQQWSVTGPRSDSVRGSTSGGEPTAGKKSPTPRGHQRPRHAK